MKDRIPKEFRYDLMVSLVNPKNKQSHVSTKQKQFFDGITPVESLVEIKITSIIH